MAAGTRAINDIFADFCTAGPMIASLAAKVGTNAIAAMPICELKTSSIGIDHGQPDVLMGIALPGRAVAKRGFSTSMAMDWSFSTQEILNPALYRMFAAHQATPTWLPDPTIEIQRILRRFWVNAQGLAIIADVPHAPAMIDTPLTVPTSIAITSASDTGGHIAADTGPIIFVQPVFGALGESVAAGQGRTGAAVQSSAGGALAGGSSKINGTLTLSATAGPNAAFLFGVIMAGGGGTLSSTSYSAWCLADGSACSSSMVINTVTNNGTTRTITFTILDEANIFGSYGSSVLGSSSGAYKPEASTHLIVRNAVDETIIYTNGSDYVFDTVTNAFYRTSTSTIPVGAELLIEYAIVKDAAQKIVFGAGTEQDLVYSLMLSQPQYTQVNGTGAVKVQGPSWFVPAIMPVGRYEIRQDGLGHGAPMSLNCMIYHSDLAPSKGFASLTNNAYWINRRMAFEGKDVVSFYGSVDGLGALLQAA